MMCNDYDVWDDGLEMSSNELWTEMTRGVIASRSIFSDYPNWGYCTSPESVGHLFEEMTELGIAQYQNDHDGWIDAIFDAIPLLVGQLTRRLTHNKLTPLDRKLKDEKLFGIAMWLSDTYEQWYREHTSDERHSQIEGWLKNQISRGRNWKMFSSSDILCAYNNLALGMRAWKYFNECEQTYWFIKKEGRRDGI